MSGLQSYLLPISLSNMNSLRLSPCKDYEANRLLSGRLQLSPGTHLLLDETALENGQLDTRGEELGQAYCSVHLHYCFIYLSWVLVCPDFVNFQGGGIYFDFSKTILSP